MLAITNMVTILAPHMEVNANVVTGMYSMIEISVNTARRFVLENMGFIPRMTV